MPVPDPNQNQSSVPVSGSTVPNSGSPASDTYRPLFGAPQVAADDTYRPLATDTPAQQEPPAPEEKPGALHRLWDWANRGIISKDTMVKAMTGMSPDDLNEALSPFADETPMHAALREFTRGTLQDIGALGSSLTSPLSVGTIAGGELIKGAQSTTQVAAALKGVRAAEASVSAADVAYTARITEATNATAQADRAVQAARAAEAAETAGKGSRAATIAAQNTASEAVANASRARQALQEAQAAQREAAVQAARATYAHQEAAKAASLIPIPGQVAKAAPVVRTLGGLFAAQGIEQAATGRQEGETPEDEIERRLMGLGFATLAAEGFKGSKMDVPLSEVPARAVDFGKDGVEMTKKAAQKAVDLVSGSLGVSQDFDTVVKNISKPSAKQYQNYVDKIENVSDDLKAILNANKDVEDPKGFANAIDGHIKRQEGILQAQAGATKNSPEPVVPDIMNRVSQSLDKFFDENRGAYGSDMDVAEAKKKLLERVFQTRGTQQMQPPNLFEAENIRWSLGQESKPQFAANAVPTTNAYKAGAAEIASVLRDAVDESYNNKGVKDVKEWRQKEANLIDIRDRLKLAQAKADALGQPGIWKSMFAKVGTPSAIIAAAFGHPIGVGMLAAGMTGDYIHQLATNPNSLVQRAVKLAAREPAAQVAQPTVSPWVSPAPPATPAQLGPVPSGGAPTPAATPVPGAATEEFVPPSRENTDLHSSLATHYGKSIKNTNYADLEARFHNDVKTKTEHGVDLDTSEKTILGKINASDAKDTKAAEKAREKAAKEQEKTIKEAQESYRPLVETKDLENLQQVSIQKLKEMAAEVPEFVKDLSIQKNSLSSGTVGQLNYKGKPLFYLGVPLAELEEELGPIKKVLGKAADVLTKGQDADAEATFKHLTRMPQTEYKVPAGGLMPSPPNELSTPEQTNYHELGHVFAGHLNGFKADEIGSRLNPENPAGAAAYTKFHFDELGDEKGRVTRESLGNKLPNLLETLMGGAAADEVHSGLDRFNAGTENDRLTGYRLLTQSLGMSHDEAADLLEAATDRAAEKLKHPVTHGILKENAGVREEGLPDTHLFSKERLESMRQEHDRRMEEYEKQNRAGGSRAGRKGYEGLDTRAAQAGGGPVTQRVSQTQTVLSPAERSTGNPEHDAMIKAAGAVPGGVQEGVKGIVPDFTMFHDPLTGSTLAVPVDELTEQAVRDKLADSRKKFKLAQAAQTKLPPQPRLPDTGTYAAIKTDDGSIYFDDEPEKQRTHIMLAKDLNIPPERVVSGGWLKDGDYEAAERSDAGRWGEQARAKQLVESKRQTEDQQKGLISTRLPSSKKSTENPITQDLTIGRQALEQVPGMADKMAKLVRKYPGFKIPENIKDPAKVLDRFVSHVKENLKQLYNNVPPEVQAANSRWYDSANGLAQRLSEKYGTTMNQMAGAIAAMSPQKDWDQNVSLAERVNDIYHTKQDVETTPEMLTKAKEIASRKTGRTFKPMAKVLAGKTLSELTKPIERAAWVRLYDEAHNPREYQSIDPATGEGRGIVHTAAGQPQRVSWGGLNEVGKALSILQDGSRENISNNLGDAHKVRNFYNNIVDPNNPRGDVTIDTHAVAAGLVRPLGGNSTEVLHNFGAGGAPGSVVNGVNGTYPLYADAYREAAKELGIQPRQLQSVVWEHVRNIFPGEIKRQPSLVDAVNNIWKDYADRKISLDKAHELVRQSANQAVQGLVSKRKISPEDFQKEIGKGGLQALGGEK